MDPLEGLRDLQGSLDHPLRATGIEGGLVGRQYTGIEEGDLVTVLGRKRGPTPRHISREGEAKMSRKMLGAERCSGDRCHRT